MRRWFLQPAILSGGFILAAVLAGALLAPLWFPDDPLDMVGAPFTWPGADPGLPLGTDLMGRDLLAGLLHGARVSLLVGLSSAVIALVIGVVVGAAAGFYRGAADAVLMRITEFFQTIPAFLLAIILVAVLEPSLGTIIFALGVTSWTSIARLVRSEFISLREREFVRASIALGASDFHLIVHEILPNAWTPIIVSTGLLVAQRHPFGGRPVLPGAGGSERGELGVDDRAGPRRLAHRLVHDGDPGPGDRGDGAGPEPAERRAARGAQPQVAARWRRGAAAAGLTEVRPGCAAGPAAPPGARKGRAWRVPCEACPAPRNGCASAFAPVRSGAPDPPWYWP